MRFALAFLLMLAMPALAEVYTWRDEQGVVHYSDQKPKNAVVRKVDVKANIEAEDDDKSLYRQVIDWLFKPESEKAETTKSQSVDKKFIPPPKVEMYATEWCGYCAKARQFFHANQIAYVEYDIERNAEARARYDAFKGRAIPIIFIDGQRINGFNQSYIEKVLKERQ